MGAGAGTGSLAHVCHLPVQVGACVQEGGLNAGKGVLSKVVHAEVVLEGHWGDPVDCGCHRGTML